MNIIYTVITAGVDDLKEPLVITPGWIYLCYTDNPKLTSNHWMIVDLSEYINPARDLAKLIKLTARLKNSIYLDASFYINCDLNVFWERHFMPGKLCVMQHPWRNCPYTEIDEVLATGKDTLDNCNKIRATFENAGLLPNSGMCASGIMMRDGSPLVDEFCMEWYNTYLSLGPRDQLAWALVNQKHPEITHRFDYDYRNETAFLHTPHLTRPRKRLARLADYKKRGLL